MTTNMTDVASTMWPLSIVKVRLEELAEDFQYRERHFLITSPTLMCLIGNCEVSFDNSPIYV